MQAYEIRILRPDGKLSIATFGSYPDPKFAIAAARGIAGNKPFQVWSDAGCVHDGLACAAPGRPEPAHRPAP